MWGEMRLRRRRRQTRKVYQRERAGGKRWKGWGESEKKNEVSAQMGTREEKGGVGFHIGRKEIKNALRRIFTSTQHHRTIGGGGVGEWGETEDFFFLRSPQPPNPSLPIRPITIPDIRFPTLVIRVRRRSLQGYGNDCSRSMNMNISKQIDWVCKGEFELSFAIQIIFLLQEICFLHGGKVKGSKSARAPQV